MRKRASGLLAAAILQASMAHGLGLGDITLRSALDEPLDAEIKLRNTGELGDTQILVNLASTEDFERVGSERVFFLSEFDFSVELDGNGDGVVRITTENPVQEPYLDFVIEVRWPNGRVLREYTVLMDLPVFDAEPVPMRATAPAVEPAPAPQVTAPQSKPRSRVARVAPAIPGGDAANWSGDRYGPVESNDTLWSIASRVTPGGASVQQMMIGLQRANPKAFIRGNVNLIKAGYVLRVPTVDMLSDISHEAALAELQEHDRAWRTGEPLSRPTTDLVAPVVDAGSPEDEAYLQLSGDQADDLVGSGAGGEAEEGALSAQVAAANENLVAAERENEELRQRLEALESQVEDYQRLVELQSDSGVAATESAAAAEELDAQQPPAPAPVAAEPARTEEPGFIESLMQNTMALMIAGGVFFIGLVLLLLKRNRSEENYNYGPLPDNGLPTQSRKVEAEAPAAATPVAAAAAPAIPEVERPLAQTEESPTTDPVAEAEIYVAYGRLDKATAMLTDALAADPEHSEARIKLMEVYADSDNKDGFLDQYAELERRGDNASLAQAADILTMAGRDWLDGGSAADELADNWAPDTVEAEEGDALATLPESDAGDDIGALDLSEGLDLSDESVEDDALDDLDLGDLDLDADITADASVEAEVEAEPDAVLELDGAMDEPEALESAAEEPEAEPTIELDAGLDDLGELELDSATDGNTDELDFLDDGDAIQTQIELAQAYMDMGDAEGAREILEEVQRDGNDEQRKVADELLASLGN